MQNDIDKSAFYHFGILPQIYIHSPKEDQYSKSYIARVKCDCGCTEWLEDGCTMILGHYYDGTPIYKDVHRCKQCKEVRMAHHVSAQNDGEV